MDVITFRVQLLLDSINTAFQTGFLEDRIFSDVREDNDKLLSAIDEFCQENPHEAGDTTTLRDGCLRVCSSYTRIGFDRQRSIMHGFSMIVMGYSKWISKLRIEIPRNPEYTYEP